MPLDDQTDPHTGLPQREADTLARHARHRAKMAYLLIWICSTVGMFIATAFMLFITKADAHNPAFYIPFIIFAVIMAAAIFLTVKITRFYNVN